MFSKYFKIPNQKQAKQVKGDKINLWVVFGIGIIIGGAYLYYKLRRVHPDQNKINQLRRLIDKSFSAAEPSLCPLTKQKTKRIKDGNLSMDIHYISKLQNKNKTTLSSTRDPFMPPFEKGIMIAQLPPKHRLLYNKFYFFKNHLLVVTQQYQQQTSRIEFEDFKQTLLVTTALNGLFFYNCGKNSGFSQNHKHIQVLPNQSLKLPIIKQLLEQIATSNLELLKYKSKQNINIHLFKGFKFIHGIVLMPQKINEDSLQQSAVYFKRAEEVLFTYHSKLLKNPSFSYNIIGCGKFLMMIPRKSQKTVGQLGVNAICFMGSMLIKDQKLFQKIEYLCKPSDILKDLTYNQIPQ